jgi:hypothetical protein
MLREVLAAVPLAAGAFGVVVAAHLAAQAAVTRAMRRQDAACPFEDDDHQPLPLGAGVLLAVGESCRLVATGFGTLRPLPRTRGAGTPVVLLVAPPLPRAAMRRLARHLGGSGRPVTVLCAPRRRYDERAGARLASAIERARGRAAVLDVVAHGASAPFVLRLLATSLGATLGVRAVVAVGARLAAVAAPPRVELLSIYSLDDVWLQPPDAGYHARAFNVAVRGEGHVGLLRSARAMAIVAENLVPLDRPLVRPGSAA